MSLESELLDAGIEHARAEDAMDLDALALAEARLRAAARNIADAIMRDVMAEVEE